MKLEIVERPCRMTKPPNQRRVWKICDEHGNHVANTADERFVNFLRRRQDYVRGAISTESDVPIPGWPPRLVRTLHAALGLADEAGEIAKAVKSCIFYGSKFDSENLKEEAGDLLWYLAILSDAIGVPLDEIMDANLRKLRARYPDGFTQDDALNRDAVRERAALTENHDARTDA